jgi:hypothetical protein
VLRLVMVMLVMWKSLCIVDCKTAAVLMLVIHSSSRLQDREHRGKGFIQRDVGTDIQNGVHAPYFSESTCLCFCLLVLTCLLKTQIKPACYRLLLAYVGLCLFTLAYACSSNDTVLTLH